MKKLLHLQNIYYLINILVLIILLSYKNITKNKEMTLLTICYIAIFISFLFLLLADFLDKTYNSRFIIVFLDFIFLILFARIGLLHHEYNQINTVDLRFELATKLNNCRMLTWIVLLLRSIFQCTKCKRNKTTLEQPDNNKNDGSFL